MPENVRLLQPKGNSAMSEVVVRHEFSTFTLVVGFIVALCVGALAGVVISHAAALDDLNDRVILNEAWVRTHRHDAPGAQAAPLTETQNERTE